MIIRLIKAALLAMVLAAIVQSLPDVRRYLKLLCARCGCGLGPRSRTNVTGEAGDCGNDLGFCGRLSDRFPGGPGRAPERLRESWRGIRNSPEARKLAADAMGIAELAMRRAAGSTLSGTANGLVRDADPQAGGRPPGQARGLTVTPGCCGSGWPTGHVRP